MSELDRMTMADVAQREHDKLVAEITRLRADFNDCNFTREALKQQVIKLRAALAEIANDCCFEECDRWKIRDKALKARIVT